MSLDPLTTKSCKFNHDIQMSQWIVSMFLSHSVLCLNLRCAAHGSSVITNDKRALGCDKPSTATDLDLCHWKSLRLRHKHHSLMEMCDGQSSESSTFCAYIGGVDMTLRSTIKTWQTLSTFHWINVYYPSACFCRNTFPVWMTVKSKVQIDRASYLGNTRISPLPSCELGCSAHDRRESSASSWQIGFTNSCDMWVISNLAFALGPFPVSSMLFHPFGGRELLAQASWANLTCVHVLFLLSLKPGTYNRFQSRLWQDIPVCEEKWDSQIHDWAGNVNIVIWVMCSFATSGYG